MLYISTDAVFDGKSGDYLETDEPNPQNVYARTKLDGERAVIEEAPDAVVARVNFYGWSLTGKRSLAEFFFNNLKVGQQIKGFTDVYYNPMLVNGLALILMKLFEKDLNGIYHTVSSETLSKYDFGVRLAEKFEFDPELITPVSISDAGLVASRSNNLTLSTEKITTDLGIEMPGVSEGLQKYKKLYEEKYPEHIRQMIKS